MNNNEIMNNEVVEATEEVIENAGLSKGVKIAAGIGLTCKRVLSLFSLFFERRKNYAAVSI